jgi:hypothetical protein
VPVFNVDEQGRDWLERAGSLIQAALPEFVSKQ